MDKKHSENMEKLEQEFQQIQQGIKIENGHDGTKILNQIETFMDGVRSLQDYLKENNRQIKEEKALVIGAAKLLQQAIGKQKRSIL